MTVKPLLNLFKAIFAIPLLIVALFNFYCDANWIWRAAPPWVISGSGHNRVMDLKMRAVKPLQVVFRHPDAVLIGSSKVYRGFDTERVLNPVTYNFGVSSMRARELAGYIEYIDRWVKPKQLLVMLDYFMFDADIWYEDGYDIRIGRVGYFPEQILRGLFSGDSVRDSILVLRAPDAGDGAWSASGFKFTCWRPATVTTRIESLLVEDYVYERFDYQGLDLLVSAIATIKSHGTDTVIYFSPKHELEIAAAANAKPLALSEFYKLVEDRLLRINLRVSQYKYSSPTIASEPVLNGSTDSWLDPLHFSSRVGLDLLQSKHWGRISRLSSTTPSACIDHTR